MVDDEPAVAEATGRVLKIGVPSADVQLTTSPEQAIHTLRKGDVAVLLCDLHMPVYDGTVVLKEGFDCNPDLVSILLTGQATKDGMIRALNEGHLWRILEKPWRPDELCRWVREALAEYERRSAATAARRAEGKRGPLPVFSPLAKPSPRRLVIHKSAANAARFRAGPAPRPAPPAEPKTVAPESVRQIDRRYRDLTLLREGGTGAVFKARDTLLDIPVAIKVLSDGIAKDREAMDLLFAEARIAMQLSHKHIVRLHNIHESGGCYYLVMEYIDGSSLRDLLAELGVLPPSMVVQIVGICEDALGYAHRHHVFHRDLKPDNLMLSEAGILKIIDFGIASFEGAVRGRLGLEGTPFYMSPEQIGGAPADERMDLYSLGVMIHEFLTGELPPSVGAETRPGFLEYRPTAAPELPEPIRAVLERAFAEDPADRWNDVSEFARHFRAAAAIAYPAAE